MEVVEADERLEALTIRLNQMDLNRLIALVPELARDDKVRQMARITRAVAARIVFGEGLAVLERRYDVGYPVNEHVPELEEV